MSPSQLRGLPSRRRALSPILSSVPQSLRARPRIEVPEIPLRFLCEGEESLGTLARISRAGLFVCSEHLPRPGAVVAVQFRLPEGKLMDLRGQVRWNTETLASAGVPPGFGVVLREPPRECRAFFRTVLARAEGKSEAERGEV